MSEPDPAVIFIHIPKTGGITLRRVLEQQYPPSQVHVFDYENLLFAIARFGRLLPAQRAQYRLFIGHVYFGLDRLLPMPSTYITFLRDPVERIISHYYFDRTLTRDAFGQERKPSRISLFEYLNDPNRIETQNYQVRMLAGVSPRGGESQLTRAALDTAKENLKNRFSVVGLTEEYDTSLLLLQRAFGWTIPPYARRNVTKTKPPRSEIDARAREWMEEHNTLDRELYAFGSELFQAQCAAYGDSLPRDLAHFRAKNELYQQTLVANKT